MKELTKNEMCRLMYAINVEGIDNTSWLIESLYEKANAQDVFGTDDNSVVLEPSLHWFKFLGFSIKGKSISLSSTRIKTFQKEIEKRTIKQRDITLKRAVNAVNRYLYKGFNDFSWATQVLEVINVKEDVNTLNTFVMDCLRAVQTKKTKIGGLGFVKTQTTGCIARGTGKNVIANILKTNIKIEGYYTIGCMQNAIKTRRGAFNTLVASL